MSQEVFPAELPQSPRVHNTLEHEDQVRVLHQDLHPEVSPKAACVRGARCGGLPPDVQCQRANQLEDAAGQLPETAVEHGDR